MPYALKQLGMISHAERCGGELFVCARSADGAIFQPAMRAFSLACLILASPSAAALGLVAPTSTTTGSAARHCSTARLRPRRSGCGIVMKVRVGIIGLLPN